MRQKVSTLRPLRAVAAVAAAAASLAAGAAPLDVLLSAAPAPAAPTSGWPLTSVELARDIANDRVDVLGLRQGTAYEGTRIGNYHGSHLRLGLRQGRWLGELTGWQRQLQDRSDTHHLRSWQAALQGRISAQDDPAQGPVWAARLGAWGNRSGMLTRRTGASLQADTLDAQLTDLRLHRARDQQWQLDLLASRRAAGLLWNGFAGAGTSRVRNDGVSASASVGGCAYDLAFGKTQLVATPAASCQDALIFAIPNALLPYDARAETTYRARYAHAGGSVRWAGEAWSAALGYEFQQWWREGIDDLLASRGTAVYDRNHILVGELGWAWSPALRLLLRGQYMQHQFVGELPMAYNTLTASRFAHRYGLVSGVVQLDF